MSEPAIGVAVIERTLLTLPLSPGVYRMLDGKGEALYVGKSEAAQEARVQLHPVRPAVRAAAADGVADRQHGDRHHPHRAEALLLEANLIKRLKPRYNIVLRDDKNYPC